MTAIADYAYLHCRVSMRAEGLLSSKRMGELAVVPSGQITEILQEAKFQDLAENHPTTPRELEQAVIKDYLEDIEVLIRPLKGAARAFLNHWKYRYEIINLKRCIRHQVAGLPPAELRDSLIDIGSMEELPLEDLLRAENAEEVLRRLEGTAYAEMARHAREVYEERHSLFDLEAVLDSQYYRGLFDRYKALSENDRKPLSRLLRELADQIHLVWLLRYRFVFGLAPPHAFLLLIPSGRMLNQAQLLELVQMEKAADVMQALPPALAEDLGNPTSIVAVEKSMDKRTQRAAHQVLRYTQFNLARVIAYLALRERQNLKVHEARKGRILSLYEESIRIEETLPETLIGGAGA